MCHVAVPFPAAHATLLRPSQESTCLDARQGVVKYDRDEAGEVQQICVILAIVV